MATETPEVRAIATHTAALTMMFSGNPELIAGILFSANFIQDDVLLKMSGYDNPIGKAATLVEAVKKEIEKAPERFGDFMIILAENAENIIDDLMLNYQSFRQSMSDSVEPFCITQPDQPIPQAPVPDETEALLSTVDNKTLTEDDWNVVSVECGSLAAKWEQLSAYLGLAKANIDIIRESRPRDIAGCWSEALSQWIKQNYSTQRFGLPSWRSLLKAVAIVDRRLCKELAAKHPLEMLLVPFAVVHSPASSDKRQPSLERIRSTIKEMEAILSSLELKAQSKLEQSQRNVSNMRHFLTALFKCLPETSRVEMIRSGMDKMKAHFSSLVLEVQSALESHSDVRKVRHFLTTFFKHDFSETSDLEKLFTTVTLNDLWDYHNYSPLEQLVNKFLPSDQEVGSLMKAYKVHLSGFYLTTKLIDYVKYQNLSIDDSHEESYQRSPKLTPKKHKKIKVVLQLDRKISQISLDYVVKLWQSFAEEYKIPSLTAVIDRVVAGSLVVTWRVPQHIADAILPRSKFFRSHGIVLVSIDDVIIYEEKQMADKEKRFLELCRTVSADIRDFSSLLAEGVDLNIYDELGLHPLGYISFLGRQDLVELFLKYRADIDMAMKDDFGDTALVTAVGEGHFHVAKILMKNGADMNYRNKKGHSILFRAAHMGNSDIVVVLLQHGAVVNLPNDDDLGDTALGAAVSEGHLHVAEILVKNGANVNYRNKNGKSVLWIASFQGHTKIVLLLLHHHAEVDLPNDDDLRETALVTAVIKGHLHIAEILVKNGADVNYRNKKGMSVLCFACIHGHTEIVLLLLHHHAAVDLPNDFDVGDTALGAAVQNGHLYIAEILVENGADVNYRNKKGKSVLWKASFEGHTEIVLLLLRHQATVDLPTDDECGETALIPACGNGHYDVAVLLINHRADVNYLSTYGVTAMYFAAKSNHPRLVELLLAHGADVNKGVQSPLYGSCHEGNIEMVQLLVHHHAAIDQPTDDGVIAPTPLIAASDENHIEVARFLVECGASIDYQNKCGYSALLVACIRGNTDIVKLLIQSNANIELKNNEGRTALMVAAWKGHSSIVAELVRARAQIQIDAQDQAGFSSLMLAIHNKHVEVVESLLNAKANPNITENIIGWSPLHFAANTANMHIIKLLLQKGANADLRDKIGKTAADICEDEDIRDELRRHAISQTQTSTQTTADENQRKTEEVMSHYRKLLSESIDSLEDSLLPERWEKKLHPRKAKIPSVGEQLHIHEQTV